MEFSAVLGVRPCCLKKANIPLLTHPPANAAGIVTKTHLGFLPPSPLSFPAGGSVAGAVGHRIPCPINCTLDGNSFLPMKYGSHEHQSSNSRSKGGASSLALACALGIISCCGMRHHMAFASASSLTMEKVAKTNIEVKTAMDLLINSKGADEAEKYLRKTIRAYDEDLEAGYRARVALIEVLMHRLELDRIKQGKYKEAAELCHSIRDNKNYEHLLERDRKLHLVQAFIYGMLNDEKKAKHFWKKFKKPSKAGLPFPGRHD